MNTEWVAGGLLAVSVLACGCGEESVRVVAYADASTTGGANGGSTTGGASGNGGANGGSGMGGAHEGTCADPEEIPSLKEAWWEPHWTANRPALPLPNCGIPNGSSSSPAVVGRWRVPETGAYHESDWSRDLEGVWVYSRVCGKPDACGVASPQNLPEVPWDTNAFPGSGSTMFTLQAGEVWYFWFQHMDPSCAPRPDRGTAVLRIWPEP